MQKFESLVNTEGFQTIRRDESNPISFESLVNTEGFQTRGICPCIRTSFESFVNTEGFQTTTTHCMPVKRFESLVNTEGFQTIIKKYKKCLTSTNSPDILYDCCGERKQHGFLKRNSKK